MCNQGKQNNFFEKQAGAELCQAQYKLELAKFWFGSVACLKFDCLIVNSISFDFIWLVNPISKKWKDLIFWQKLER